MQTTRAIRTDRWKYVARFPDGPFELYDMQVDPQYDIWKGGRSKAKLHTISR